MERVAQDEELFAECLDFFASDENFEQLGECLKTKKYAQAFEHAHALKGVAANLGLTPLYEPVSAISELLRNEQSALPAENELPPLSAQLQKEYLTLIERKAQFEALLT